MNEWLTKQSSSELLKFLLEIALFRDLERHSMDKRQDDLIETAKRYGVDPKKIEAELKAETKEKKAAKGKKKSVSMKQKVQTSAKKKGK